MTNQDFQGIKTDAFSVIKGKKCGELVISAYKSNRSNGKRIIKNTISLNDFSDDYPFSVYLGTGEWEVDADGKRSISSEDFVQWGKGVFPSQEFNREGIATMLTRAPLCRYEYEYHVLGLKNSSVIGKLERGVPKLYMRDGIKAVDMIRLGIDEYRDVFNSDKEIIFIEIRLGEGMSEGIKAAIIYPDLVIQEGVTSENETLFYSGKIPENSIRGWLNSISPPGIRGFMPLVGCEIREMRSLGSIRSMKQMFIEMN